MTYRLFSADDHDLLAKEWMLTDGAGGYAMGTAAGACTRRYHGLLIPAFHPPVGRVMLLKNADVFVETDGRSTALSCNLYPGAISPDGRETILEFEADECVRWLHRIASGCLLRTFRLDVEGLTMEFRNESDRRLKLEVHPFVVFRDHHGEQHEGPLDWPRHLAIDAEDWETISEPIWYHDFVHPRESERGLPDRESALRPVRLIRELAAGEEASIRFRSLRSEPSPFHWEEASEETNPFRASTRRFVARGTERTTILAGYPWFNDWGRDMMISLPGCLLANGQVAEARETILGYARRMKNGLIPNRFLDDGEGADYNTVDGTLWMFEATRRTLVAEPDLEFATEMAGHLRHSIQAHLQGTDFGIEVDHDGLLTQGGPGLQLTWMDAKIGDWVVTPRTGKPVEINALWINALSVLHMLPHPPKWLDISLNRARNGFLRYWREDRGWFADVLDPDNAQLRPNQVIALSLATVAVPDAWAQRALDSVAAHLFTPRGLRTLAPFEEGYQERFEGDMRQRDAAYHQGTVWPWLMGPYATALARFGRRDEAKRILAGMVPLLEECGLGGISEVYDAGWPQRPAGCPFQAWSVAEPARAWDDLEQADRLTA